MSEQKLPWERKAAENKAIEAFFATHAPTHTYRVDDGSRVCVPFPLPACSLLQVTGLADYAAVEEELAPLKLTPLFVVDRGTKRAVVQMTWADYEKPTEYKEFIVNALGSMSSDNAELCQAGDFSVGSTWNFGLCSFAFAEQAVHVPLKLALTGPFSPIAIETGRGALGYPKFPAESIEIGGKVVADGKTVFGAATCDFTKAPGMLTNIVNTFRVISWLGLGAVMAAAKRGFMSITSRTPEEFGSQTFDMDFVAGNGAAYLYDPSVHGDAREQWLGEHSMVERFRKFNWQPRLVQVTPGCAISVPTTDLPAERLPDLKLIDEAPVDNKFLV